MRLEVESNRVIAGLQQVAGLRRPPPIVHRTLGAVLPFLLSRAEPLDESAEVVKRRRIDHEGTGESLEDPELDEVA